MTASEIRAASAARHDRTIATTNAIVDRAMRARGRSPALRAAAAACPSCRTATVDASGSVDVTPDGQDALDAAALYQKCPKCGAVIPRGDYRPAPPPTKTFRDPHLTPAAAHLRAAAAKTAEDASAAAWTATSKAAKSGKPADLKKAATLHATAADAQRQAATDDAASAATHASAAQQHDVQAAQHAADAAPDESDDDSNPDTTDDDEPSNKSASHRRLARFMPPNPYARTTARSADLSAARIAGAEAYREAGVPPDPYRIGLELRRLEANPTHAIAPPPLPRDASGTPDPYNTTALRAHQRRREGGRA